MTKHGKKNISFKKVVASSFRLAKGGFSRSELLRTVADQPAPTKHYGKSVICRRASLKRQCSVRGCPWSSVVRDDPQNHAPWELTFTFHSFSAPVTSRSRPAPAYLATFLDDKTLVIRKFRSQKQNSSVFSLIRPTGNRNDCRTFNKSASTPHYMYKSSNTPIGNFNNDQRHF